MEERTENSGHRHHEDVLQIQKAFHAHGWPVTYWQAANAWDEYSDAYAAGWLGFDEDDVDGIVNCALPYLDRNTYIGELEKAVNSILATDDVAKIHQIVRDLASSKFISL